MHLEDFKGTVSHGTARNEDLIPCFVETLASLLEAHKAKIRRADPYAEISREIYHVTRWILSIQAKLVSSEYDFSDEPADWDLEYLFDTLNQFAPEGYYFGSHVGDGSDYGFWEHEENE